MRSPARLRALIRERDGGDCSLCGKPMDFTLDRRANMAPTLEHVVPRAAGGHTVLDNLRLAHGSCNRRKAGIHEGADFGVLNDPARTPGARSDRYEMQQRARDAMLRSQ